MRPELKSRSQSKKYLLSIRLEILEENYFFFKVPLLGKISQYRIWYQRRLNWTPPQPTKKCWKIQSVGCTEYYFKTINVHWYFWAIALIKWQYFYIRIGLKNEMFDAIWHPSPSPIKWSVCARPWLKFWYWN